MLAVGMRLGPYQILGSLGRGGMGEVYRARDTRLDREVAVKVVPEPLAQDPRRLARFEREARAVAALAHPNLLVLHDVGREQGVPFVVTELLEFKEQLAVLLVGMLFILLTADVRVSEVLDLGWRGALTVAVLALLVRPLNVWTATRGSGLSVRERAFLAWLGPRGIVAAAVASLFAEELVRAGVPEGIELRALVFLVIGSTVLVQGLGGGPLGRRLVQEVIQGELRGREAVVAVGHREQRPPRTRGEERGVLVGVGVRVGLGRATPGQRERRRPLGLRRDASELHVVAAAQERASHPPVSSSRAGAGARGLCAKASSATGRPPTRCSWMIRSRASGVQRRYQTPSGYTTAIGPSRQMRRQSTLER